MGEVSCILLLVERGPRAHQSLNKALLLARHFKAPLELLLCEVDQTQSGAGGGRTECVAEGQRYLEALRKTVIAADVPLASEAICAISVPEGIAAKLKRTQALLLVKNAPVGQGMSGPADWHLAGSLEIPLLLTRGRPWRAQPRFAGALDLSGTQAQRLEVRMVALLERLAAHCGAELDYLFADPGRAHGAAHAHRRMAMLLHDGRPGAGRLQYCSAEPIEVLPRLIRQRDYDLLAVGRPAGNAALDATKSVARMLQAAAGDTLLVPPGAEGGPGLGALSVSAAAVL